MDTSQGVAEKQNMCETLAYWRVCVCVCVGVCVCRVRERERVRVRVCVRACVRARARALSHAKRQLRRASCCPSLSVVAADDLLAQRDACEGAEVEYRRWL